MGSFFQWTVGENPDGRKAPLTVEMDRWSYGAGGGVPFALWYFLGKELPKSQ